MEFATALIDEHQAFADTVAAGDPAAPVPTCPGWTVQQLFRHVGRGVRWSAQMVQDQATESLDPRAVPGGKPPEDPAAATNWLTFSPIYTPQNKAPNCQRSVYTYYTKVIMPDGPIFIMTRFNIKKFWRRNMAAMGKKKVAKMP